MRGGWTKIDDRTVPSAKHRAITQNMEKYRNYIGWGAIALAALRFLPLPLPLLPPMLSSGQFMQMPLLGGVLLMLFPMLLFAAGICLVKGMDAGKNLFAIWAGFGGLAAMMNLQYNPVEAAVDLTMLGTCLVVLYWGAWKRRGAWKR